jgi:ubiquinone/menaquinone biosynthesis C-methylase UbiE
MLARVLEPEVMDTPEEASDYDAMDHAEVNARFCDDLLAGGALEGSVLDVGTGTALIPIELCKRASGVTVVAIDLADHMLALARANVARAGLSARVRLERVDAKATPYPDRAFAATVSNSIVHHIPEPAGVLAEMWRVTATGGRLFVRDLARPQTEAEVDRLVGLYGGARPSEPERVASFERQRALLRASLCAALTPGEIREMVTPLGIDPGRVTMTSDRHWTLSATKPERA